MDAIVTAGGIPQPKDPLYAYAKGNPKAMIDVAGKPMVQWVLDALSEAANVENIILIGLTAKSGLTCSKPIHYISNQGRMLANIVAGVDKVLELNPESEYVLIVSSDIPAVKGEQIDWLIDTAMQTQDDIYYGVCPRDVMETRFPESHRTYTKLKDMQICGADMNIAHVRMATEHLDMWEELIGNRKSPLKQAATIGFGTVFLLAAGRLTLADAVERVGKRIGIAGRPIVWDEAEPCMDVDKPHQLELMRKDMERLQAENAAKPSKAEKVGKAEKPSKPRKAAAPRKSLSDTQPVKRRAPARTKKAPAKAPAKSEKPPAKTPVKPKVK